MKLWLTNGFIICQFIDAINIEENVLKHLCFRYDEAFQVLTLGHQQPTVASDAFLRLKTTLIGQWPDAKQPIKPTHPSADIRDDKH